jgi:hypothetical protein
MCAASPSTHPQSRVWKTLPGIEPGPTEHQLGALTTVLSDTSTIKTTWDDYFGFFPYPPATFSTLQRIHFLKTPRKIPENSNIQPDDAPSININFPDFFISTCSR